MKWTKKMKGAGKKAAVTVTALGMVLTAFPPIPAKAAEEFAGQLTSVESVEKGSKDNIVVVKFNGGVTAQLTFLEDVQFGRLKEYLYIEKKKCVGKNDEMEGKYYTTKYQTPQGKGVNFTIDV